MTDREYILLLLKENPSLTQVELSEMMDKSRFRYEGTLKSNAVKCGSIVDMKMYALVRE